MSISFTDAEEKDRWSGSTWAIEDEWRLAELIARVAVGQARVVERILCVTGDMPPGHPKGGFAGAKKLLNVETGKGTYHRDGCVYQVIA